MEVSPPICFILRPANLLQPLLGDPSAPLPPPIIPAVESSRPPVYSPEMTALIGSDLSHRGSSRTPKQLQNPPTLPPRANPESSDAKILGPLSKRREVNLRWRFFERETAKVWPPIEVSRVHAVQPPTPHGKPTETGTTERGDTGDVGQPTPPLVGFQGTSVLRDLESIASPGPNIPKHAANPSFHTSTVNRFIRRQHRKLLGNIPILTYSKHPNSPVGKYGVSLSPLACSRLVDLTSTVPMADEADLAWLRLPPPLQKPRVELDSPPSRETKSDRNPPVYRGSKHAAHQWPQRSNGVDGNDPPDEDRPEEGTLELKVEPRSGAEEPPKVGMRSEVDKNPQVQEKPMRAARLYAPGSNGTGEPPGQNKRGPRGRPPRNPTPSEDSKRQKRFGGTTDEGLRMEELPSRSTSPTPEGVRLFTGSMIKGGFGVPRPKP